MDAMGRIEQALSSAVDRAAGAGCPPRLAAAMHHAVFPRGARIRPRLCLSVARACGEDDPGLADAAAASIELLHCASLVHDDLPCFDDADTRRGRPSVHKAFGEPTAVLVGDALIMLAFQNLVAGASSPHRQAALILAIGRAVGAPFGIVAGQAWECESHVDLAEYHRAKTGVLFTASAAAGALAAGANPDDWCTLGEKLGEAYQVADDIRDAAGDPDQIGKPVGQDAALGRPNIVAMLGIGGAVARLEELVAAATASVPASPGGAELRALIKLEARRLLPAKLAQSAA
jgi:geranylgeranyl diphosphate synthase type II